MFEDFKAMTDSIRTDLMSYIWAGEGDEIDACKMLQRIFNNLDELETQYQEQLDHESYARKKYIEAYGRCLKLEREIKGEEEP